MIGVIALMMARGLGVGELDILFDFSEVLEGGDGAVEVDVVVEGESEREVEGGEG